MAAELIPQLKRLGPIRLHHPLPVDLLQVAAQAGYGIALAAVEQQAQAQLGIRCKRRLPAGGAGGLPAGVEAQQINGLQRLQLGPMVKAESAAAA